ncbi:MAG TPA: hypothetical protein PKJ08_07825 [Candidatus Cloacimonadota bacterium]|nr:hypothetical protein [Candidatus Cloacimonadota bacterium]
MFKKPHMNTYRFIKVNKSRIILVLGLVAFLLVLFSIIGQLLLKPTQPVHIQGIITLFDLAAEGNLPTYYSSVLLLIAALLLFVVTLMERTIKSRYVPYWAFLTIGFIYLSMDEMLMLHEGISRFIRAVTDYSGEGVLKSPWVILGTITVTVILLVFIKFITHLDQKTRYLFLIAGALYVGGAIGFEIIENLYADAYGQDLVYSMLQNLEEGMEMAGIIVFIYALLNYMGSNYGLLNLLFQPDSKS